MTRYATAATTATTATPAMIHGAADEPCSSGAGLSSGAGCSDSTGAGDGVAVADGGAVGGALISYWKVATVITFGISGLPLALTIVAGKVMFYLLGYLVAVIAGFLFTWLLGFNDPED